MLTLAKCECHHPCKPKNLKMKIKVIRINTPSPVWHTQNHWSTSRWRYRTSQERPKWDEFVFWGSWTPETHEDTEILQSRPEHWPRDLTREHKVFKSQRGWWQTTTCVTPQFPWCSLSCSTAPTRWELRLYLSSSTNQKHFSRLKVSH